MQLWQTDTPMFHLLDFFIMGLGYVKLKNWFELSDKLKKNQKLLTRSLQLLMFIYLMFLGKLTYERCQVWNNSLSLWDDVLTKYPNTAIAWINIGNVNNDLKRYKKAKWNFDNAIRIGSNLDYEAYLSRGIVKGNMGDYIGAIEDNSIAIEIKPLDSRALYKRALIYDFFGKNTEAITDLSKVIELSPGYSRAYYYRGKARIETGSHDLG